MSQLNSLPKFTIPLQQEKSTNKDWYFFWNGLYTGLPPALPTSVTVGASPYTYSAAVKGTLFISGGTVSLVQISRDGTNYYATGAIAGPFPVNASDRLKITHTGAPTATFFPT